MGDGEVKVPIKPVFEKADTSNIKKQLADIKAELEKTFEQKSAQVKPKGRSAANKQLQQEVSKLGDAIVKIEAMETKLSTAEYSVANSLRNSIKTQSDSLKGISNSYQDQATKIQMIENAHKQLEAQLQKEAQIQQTISKKEAEIASLTNKINEAASRKTETTEQKSERLNAVFERASIRDSIAQDENQLAAERAKTQAIKEQIGLLTNEKSAEQQIAQAEKEVVSANEHLKNVKQEIAQGLSDLLGSTKEIVNADKEDSAAVEQTNKKIKKQNQLRTEKPAEQKDNFGGIMSRKVYYMLRQVRLVQSELDRIGRGATAFSKNVTTGFAKASKAVLRLATSFLTLRKATDSTTKANTGFGKSLSGNFWTLLRYSLGIRSLFALMNRLRQALKDGMLNLAKYSGYVNGQMSSIATSLLYMKNAIAAGAQPFLNVLAPAIEFVSEKIAALTFNISQLVAALTGQTFVFKAKRAYVDWAASMDKAGNSAKKMKDQLMDFDKLDVIKTPKDSGAGMPDPSEMFETISPISKAIQDLADKIRDIAKQLFNPIKKAWDSKGKFVMDSWKKALINVWDLAKSIGRDFLIMWNEDATVRMWQNIFQIVGDVGQIIGNLAKNLKKAWDENKRGLKLWQNLRDIVAILVLNFRDLADYAVEWSKNLDFSRLLDSFNGLLTELKPVAEAIGEVLVDIAEKVFLEHLRFLIEEGIPKLNDTIATIANKIDWDQLVTNLKPLLDSFELLRQTIFNELVNALENVGDTFAKFVNSQDFKDFLENIAKFITKIKDSRVIEKVFTAIGDGILLMADGIVKFVNSDTFEHILDALLDFLANFDKDDFVAIVNTIIALKVAIAGFTAATKVINFLSTMKILLGLVREGVILLLSPIKKLWEVLSIGFSKLLDVLAPKLFKFLAEFGLQFAGIISIIGGLTIAITSFVDMFLNGWNTISTILEALGLALAAVGAVMAGLLTGPVAALVAGIIFAVSQIVILVKDNWDVICGFFKDAWNFISGIFTTIWDAITGFFSGIGDKFMNLISWFKNGLNNLGKLFSTAFNAILGFGKSFANGFINVFNLIWHGIKSAINGIISGVEWMANAVVSGVNMVIDVLNNLSFDIPDWVPFVGGSHFGFNISKLGRVSLPRLAEGAVIPPNKEFMAVLGDQKEGTNIEAPLDTIKQALAEVLQQMQGTGDNGDIVIQIDGNEVFRAVRKRNDMYKKSTGKSAFAV